MNMKCLICDSTELFGIDHHSRRHYLDCHHCGAIFLSPSERLFPDAQRARYASHQNNIDDRGYREFLTPLREAILPHLLPGAKGLDFGCGPTRSLSQLFGERGYSVDDYDLFFFQDNTLLQKRYDFVTASEVFEHLEYPKEVFSLLQGILNPGGFLGVMTESFSDEMNFFDWYYAKDPTHVLFFRDQTWKYFEHVWSFKRVTQGKRVRVFQKT